MQKTTNILECILTPTSIFGAECDLSDIKLYIATSDRIVAAARRLQIDANDLDDNEYEKYLRDKARLEKSILKVFKRQITKQFIS